MYVVDVTTRTACPCGILGFGPQSLENQVSYKRHSYLKIHTIRRGEICDVEKYVPLHTRRCELAGKLNLSGGGR